MIFDKIENLSKYTSIPNLSLILDFLKNKNLLELLEGDIEIMGKKLFVKVLRYFPEQAEHTNFEIHKIYTDIHIVVKGIEKIGITGRENLEEEIEDKEHREDLQFFSVSGAVSEIIVTENNFAVFFPGELHKPACTYQQLKEPILKLVFKTTP